MEKLVQRFLLLWAASCICALHIYMLRVLFALPSDIGRCRQHCHHKLDASAASTTTRPATSENHRHYWKYEYDNSHNRLLVLITPTYNRLLQKAELTRQIHTLSLIPPPLHWIVIEDAENTSSVVQQMLAHSGLKYTLMATPSEPHVAAASAAAAAANSTNSTATEKALKKQRPTRRGLHQRNLGLNYLRESPLFCNVSGVVYFADDDNTYSLELFREMRQLHGKVGVWPVAFAGGLIVERPLANRTSGRVIGWNAQYQPHRAFAIDMAGFGVDLQFLLASAPQAEFSPTAAVGNMESDFLKSLNITLDDLEPLADACSRVLVWHTKTSAVNVQQEEVLEAKKHQHSYTGTDAWH